MQSTRRYKNQRPCSLLLSNLWRREAYDEQKALSHVFVGVVMWRCGGVEVGLGG